MARREFLAAALGILLAACDSRPRVVEPGFEDVTAAAGLEIFTQTFGAVFSDIDNDGDDDLIVSKHARGPSIYLRTDVATFREATGVLPEVTGDLHGITLADLDNDGDKDLVIACGGDDGVGPGCSAKVLQNRLIEEGRLRFDDVSVSSGLAQSTQHRSRVFLPTTNDDGSRIDLYLTGKKRAEFANRFYRNAGHGDIRFEEEGVRHRCGHAYQSVAGWLL